MSVEFAPVDAASAGRVAEFLALFPGETRSLGFWQSRLALWWEQNPAATGELERGWLLLHNGAIAGFIGVIPTMFQIGGQSMRVFSATTWRVLPEHRSHSLALLLHQMRIARDSMLFSTTSITRTVEIRHAFGFAPIPRDTLARSIGVIAGRAAAARAVGRLPGGAALAFAVGPMLAAPTALASRRMDGEIDVHPVGHAGSEFDDLWARTKARYRNTNVRTADWLNWYCFACSALAKTLFAARHNGRLVGYAIWRMRSDDRGSLRKFECLDMWTDAVTQNVVPALTRAASRFARTSGADILMVPHFDASMGAALRGCGLWRQRAANRQDYVKINPRFASEVTAANSYFAAAQGDNGL